MKKQPEFSILTQTVALADAMKPGNKPPRRRVGSALSKTQEGANTALSGDNAGPRFYQVPIADENFL